jgi:tetratricopeptide (TPR) repeat protein
MLKAVDVQDQRCNGLKRERDEFMWKLYSEKAETEWQQAQCAVVIQKVWRGCRSRPKGTYYLEKQQQKKFKATHGENIIATELHDELCMHAVRLNMPHIPGLSLEPRFKAGARRRKMMATACAHIVTFFRMLVARGKARKVVTAKVLDMHNIMARRLVRFFRYIFARNFSRKAMDKKRNRTAVKIQSSIRSFLTYHKTRVIKREKRLHMWEKHHAIVLARNFKKHHEDKMAAQAELREKKALEAVIAAEEAKGRGVFDYWLCNAIGIAASEVHTNEIAAETVSNRLGALLEAVLGDVALEAGKIQLEEQMREMEAVRIRMEKERIELEKEQLRLEEERRREEAMEQDTSARESQVMSEYLEFAKERAEEDGRIVSQEATIARTRSKSNKSAVEALQTVVSSRGQKQISLPSMLQALRKSATTATATTTAATVAGVDEEKEEMSTDDYLSKVEKSVLLARSSYDAGSFDTAHTAYLQLFGLLLTTQPSDELNDMDCDALLAHCFKHEMPSSQSIDSSPTAAEAAASAASMLRPALLAMTAVSLSECLVDMYHHDLAKDRLMFSRAIRERVYGPGHLLVAEVDIALGRISTEQAMLNEANECFEKAKWAIESSHKSILGELANDNDGDDISSSIRKSERQLKKQQHAVPGGEEDEDTVLYLRIRLYSSWSRLARYCAQYGLSAQYAQHATDSCELLASARGEHYSFLSVEARSCTAKLLTICGDSKAAADILKQTLRTCIKVVGEEHPLVAASLIRLAQASLLDAPSSQLLALVDKAIVIQRKFSRSLFLENGKLDIAKALMTKGQVYMLTARYDEAQVIMEKSYEIRHELLGPAHPSVTHAILHLANLTKETGHFAEAEQNYDIVLHAMDACAQNIPALTGATVGATNKGPVPMGNFETTEAQLGKSSVLESLGQYKDALDGYEIVLQARKTIVASLQGIRTTNLAPEADPDPDTSRLDSARSARSGQQISSRVGTAQSARSISSIREEGHHDHDHDHEHEHEHEHEQNNAALLAEGSLAESTIMADGTSYVPSVSVECTRLCVGRALYHLGALREAENVLTIAHGRLVSLLGEAQGRPQPVNYHVSEGLMYLGLLASAQGHYNDADELLDKAAEMKEAILCHDHPEVARALLAMSNNLLGPGYYHDSTEVSDAAIAIATSKFAHKSPFLVDCLHNRGNVLRDTGHAAEADPHYQQALYFARQYFGDSSPAYAILLKDLAESQRRQGLLLEARETLKDCIKIHTEVYGRDHWVTAQAVMVLALVLKDEGKMDDSLSMLQNLCIPALEEGLGENHPWYVFAHGMQGICLKHTTIGHKEHNPSMEAHERVLLEEVSREGEEYVDNALDYLDVHEQGPFDQRHPWITALGGFTSAPTTPRESGAETTRRSARTAGSPGRGTTAESLGGGNTGRPLTSQSLLSDGSGFDDNNDIRPFTAHSYIASRPGTSHLALDAFLWTEAEFDNGLAQRPSTGSVDRSQSASSSSSSRGGIDVAMADAEQELVQPSSAGLDSPDRFAHRDGGEGDD